MDISKRYAIVVGLADYDDDQIATLQYAKNDAVRIADLLVTHGRFEKQCVYLLVNGIDADQQCVVDPVSPTKGNILQKVKYAVDAAGDQDMILLFFAGHGAEVSKSPYLLTCDTKMDVLQHTAVKVTELNEMLEAAGAQCIIRIFDACRSPFAEARGVMGRMTDGLEQAMLKTAKGWASLSSCSSGELAHESGELGQGVFSYYLCEGLEGKAVNEEGEVTFDRLVDYVKTSVGNWSDKQSQRQTPHLQSDLSGSLVLSRIAKSMPQRPPESANPLEALRFGIDNHLSQVAVDARNLTYTTEDEWSQVFELGMGSLREHVQAFSHPSLVISAGQEMNLRAFGGAPWQVFNADMDENAVRVDFNGRTGGIQIGFSSSEVVVPDTVLSVGVAQFSFFYWLWYIHQCSCQQLQNSFSPNPRSTKGFFTFKPIAALDGLKMENAIKELLKRVGEDILLWAGQLGQFVDGRLTPLREIGDIID